MIKECPLCGSDPVKVIYYGLPMLLCTEDFCSCLYGFWSFVAEFLPFNGYFYTYEGSYIKALYRWLTQGENQ